MKTTGLMKNLRVYWRYYWGRLRGHDMRLWGRPGTAEFEAIWYIDGIFEVVDPRNPKPYGVNYWVKPTLLQLEKLEERP